MAKRLRPLTYYYHNSTSNWCDSDFRNRLGPTQEIEEGDPASGSCSALISAVCHQPEDDIEMQRFLPAMWGTVSSEDLAVGHCCFNSFSVSSLIEGKLYA